MIPLAFLIVFGAPFAFICYLKWRADRRPDEPYDGRD